MGPAFLFRSRLPPSSSPFLLLGPVRVFFPCLRVRLLAGQRPHEDGAALTCMCVLFSALLSLPGPASLSLVLSLFFFLSLSLSLSSLLACISKTGKW